MQNFIMTLFVCSVVMSVIALFYMAIDPLLAKRYSEKGRYYVWLIILAGLIIPFRPQLYHAPIQVDVPNPPVQTMFFIFHADGNDRDNGDDGNANGNDGNNGGGNANDDGNGGNRNNENHPSFFVVADSVLGVVCGNDGIFYPPRHQALSFYKNGQPLERMYCRRCMLRTIATTQIRNGHHIGDWAFSMRQCGRATDDGVHSPPNPTTHHGFCGGRTAVYPVA
jgi:hypothetical protein